MESNVLPEQFFTSGRALVNAKVTDSRYLGRDPVVVGAVGGGEGVGRREMYRQAIMMQ